MKRILITGENSYIGLSTYNWLEKKDNYQLTKISLKSDAWKKEDFSGFDVVFHVAGIAHVSSDPSMEEIYYRVNRDLTVEVAKKAKEEGVKQFIFMSSIIVYGDSSRTEKIIRPNTVPTPSDFYGDSKLQAEKLIKQLESEKFKITILRPPMIYGKGSKGNYHKLSKMSRMVYLFPDYDNRRSMIHIDNLCEFIKAVIDNEDSGIFFPQNKEYVKTSDLVKTIAVVRRKRIVLTKIFNPLISLLFSIGTIRKMFGNLVYEKSMSEYRKINYQIREFRESIELTEVIVRDE